MLTRYDVTPEMLFYRFSELIPQHFGIPIHFLRYHQEGDDYKLIKHLNMNQLNVPSGLGLQEHYCRRWLSVRLLREMADRQSAGSTDLFPPPEVHISRFLDSNDRYLAFGFARSLILSPGKQQRDGGFSPDAGPGSDGAVCGGPHNRPGGYQRDV